MKYIHYGNDKFEINKFETISNDSRIPTKPSGGFWASRVDSNYSWKNYCIKQRYDIDLDKYIIFSIDDKARILSINNCKQLENLPQLDSKRRFYKNNLYTKLDFERLSEKYDAIEVFIREKDELYFQLFGWDCESILIMNPKIIITDEKILL